MKAEKLNKWAELLLDTGKRNNLIHFKDAKTSTVEILSPDFVTLFKRAEHAAVFEVYDPKLEDEEEEFEYFDDETVDKGEKRIPKADYLEAYQKKLKKNQILVYNAVNKPFAALKNISKRAKTAIEETGVNIAYIAFGFIHWTESADPKTVMRAPILLAPITIENESSIEPYRVKITDDETIVNPTFAFKLQNDYGIKLPDFDEDEGIEGYFAKLQAILSRLQWQVSTECKIGIFSFLKINMYKDLKDNAETIARHTNVRALLGELNKVNTENNAERIPGTGLLDLHNVVDADSSQAEAIQTALFGQSFVLQGPPGTGKSQTITNMIAECLADGKKVLFVSEKLAALNVVYEKLKAAGLEEFCLELHSHKANKRQVIDELCHTLKLQKSGVSPQAEKELRAKKDAQAKLDVYASELHKIRPIINKSLYELYEEVAACRLAPDLDFVIQNLQEKGEEYIEKAERALARFVAYIPSVGYDYRQNVWYGYVNADCSYEKALQVKADLLALAELAEGLLAIADGLKDDYGVSAEKLTRARVFADFFALAKEGDFLAPALLNPVILHKTLETVKQMQPLAKVILNKKALLDKGFDGDIYQVDGQAAYKKLTKQFSGFFSRLFSKEYRQLILGIKLCKKDGKRLNYESAVAAAQLLCTYQEKVKEFDRLQQSAEGKLGVAYAGVNSDFARCIAQLESLTGICQTGIKFGKLSTMDLAQYDGLRKKFAELSENYVKLFAKAGKAETRLLADFDLKAYDLSGVSLRSLAKKCRGCLENADKLDNWCEFTKLLQLLKGLELLSFVDYAIAKKVAADQIVAAYDKAFYTQWVDGALRLSPALLELARVPHDEAVKRFREKDELHFEINKAKIKAELSTQRPSSDMIAPGGGVSILLREGEKKRKQKGIRTLLSEIGDLVQTLKPCFLMSPLSVSTYLGADMQFDVVIFDEASQIFPQDAVGAIYRGKQLIVVGDSKQMPPSNFFNAAVDVDTDEETEDITDFESILDLCSTTFPQRRLKWHYRSRFESLISFSNQNFYDGDLVTFPASKTDEVGAGVDFVFVDGVFDRKTRTNRAEAEKITEMVFEHIEKYPDRSLGVVAFSIAQQGLIDKLISKRRRQDPSKDFFFKSDKFEPFFVKNLETVQGDERDTILFSIAYARDAQGKLLLNFGPINREGGERRLNVAVTRAKYNIRVVSSIRGADIDASGTKSVGVRLLRDYLTYAEKGGVILREENERENPFARSESPFAAEVRDFLQENGYQVDMQVGSSAFKIDLAVKYADGQDYALAVECDGASYRSSKTARDRDRLRQDNLERMGWKFYRIWSTDWFRNKRVEKERLLAAAKDALKHPLKKLKRQPPAEVSFENAVEEKPFAFPFYQKADVLKLAADLNYDVPRVVRAILETESPMSEEWLLKRICYIFGRDKVTSAVLKEYAAKMGDYGRHGITLCNGFLYLHGKEIPVLRVPAEGETPREIKYIALEELANGIRAVLKQNVTAEKSGLFKLLAAQLGFARTGDAITARLENALQTLAEEVEIEDDVLSLKD